MTMQNLKFSIIIYKLVTYARDLAYHTIVLCLMLFHADCAQNYTTGTIGTILAVVSADFSLATLDSYI